MRKRKKDRMEKEKSAFHKKVRRGYLKEAKRLSNCRVIKTDKKDINEIFDETKVLLKQKRIV